MSEISDACNIFIYHIDSSNYISIYSKNMKKIWFLTVLLVGSFLVIGCSKSEVPLDQECSLWGTCVIEVPHPDKASEENSPEVILWNDEENILVVEDKNMHTDNIINLKIWNKTLDVTLEENSATKALIEKLHEWDIVVNAREYWWFEKVGNLGFDLPKTDKQITTEPGDLVLYQWNQISLFYESNSWSYTKLWKVQMISKDGLKEILWDWDVTLVFSLLK